MASIEVELTTQIFPASVTLITSITETFTAGQVPEFEFPAVPAGKVWVVKMQAHVVQTDA